MNAPFRYPFLRVAVTGGIGAGKSTVCGLFSDLGRIVIVADEVARRMVDENAEVRDAVLREFGPGFYLPNGLLDRAKMARLVFDVPQKRDRLNAIIHPHVFRSIDLQLDSLSHQPARPYVLIEAALVYETGMDKMLDYVIVVMADEETSIRRVVERDGSSREHVLRRIAAQMPAARKARQADFVIANIGKESDLKPTVLFLDNLLCHLSRSRAS